MKQIQLPSFAIYNIVHASIINIILYINIRFSRDLLGIIIIIKLPLR